MSQEYFGIAEATKYLGYKSTKSLYQLIEYGLPVSEIGNKKRISKSDIDEFIKAHKVVKAK